MDSSKWVSRGARHNTIWYEPMYVAGRRAAYEDFVAFCRESRQLLIRFRFPRVTPELDDDGDQIDGNIN